MYVGDKLYEGLQRGVGRRELVIIIIIQYDWQVIIIKSNSVSGYIILGNSIFPLKYVYILITENE